MIVLRQLFYCICSWSRYTKGIASISSIIFLIFIRETAKQLFVSTETTDSHRKNLFAKLNVRNTATLIRFALENKLL